jgi:hypothetical protein
MTLWRPRFLSRCEMSIERAKSDRRLALGAAWAMASRSSTIA